MRKDASTSVPILPALAQRWSGRAFDPLRPLEIDTVTALCEAARWAPSCYGEAPWRLVLWNRHTDPSAFGSALATLSPGNQSWAQDAALLVLIAGKRQFSHNDQDNRWAAFDCGAASMSLCTQATALGLMTHPMAGFDSEALRTAFQIPTSVDLWAVIAVGYPLDASALSADQLEYAQKPRQRRPLAQQFFHHQWPHSDT